VASVTKPRATSLHLLQQGDSQLVLAEDAFGDQAFGDQDLSDLARGGSVHRRGLSGRRGV